MGFILPLAAAVGITLMTALWWARTGPGDMKVVSVQAAASAGPSSSSPQATRACQTRLAQFAGKDNPMRVSLVAAYAATAADVGADDERRKGGGYRSPWRDRPAGEPEAVCFFDADAFGVAAPPLPGHPARAAYDRLEEVVRPDGAPVVYQAGHKNTIDPAPMPSRAGR